VAVVGKRNDAGDLQLEVGLADRICPRVQLRQTRLRGSARGVRIGAVAGEELRSERLNVSATRFRRGYNRRRRSIAVARMLREGVPPGDRTINDFEEGCGPISG
jgi:hypothetical protein